MISKLYGEYLADTGRPQEAGISKIIHVIIILIKMYYDDLVYQSCGELELAMKAFEKAGAWHHVFILSNQLGQEESERRDLAKRISSTCTSRQLYM